MERKSERADTAYSPRFREEELPDADNERADKHSNLFNAETQSRRVRRESWSLELELESGVISLDLLLLIRRGRLARREAFRRQPSPLTQ